MASQQGGTRQAQLKSDVRLKHCASQDSRWPGPQDTSCGDVTPSCRMGHSPRQWARLHPATMRPQQEGQAPHTAGRRATHPQRHSRQGAPVPPQGARGHLCLVLCQARTLHLRPAPHAGALRAWLKGGQGDPPCCCWPHGLAVMQHLPMTQLCRQIPLAQLCRQAKGWVMSWMM